MMQLSANASTLYVCAFVSLLMVVSMLATPEPLALMMQGRNAKPTASAYLIVIPFIVVCLIPFHYLV